jgi:hypothetical protein
MMYFIPWVVFLAFVIASVPIAAWLEKRRMRAAFPEQFENPDDSGDEENEADETGEADVVVEETGEAEVVFDEGGGFGAEAVEDLSAFDDFK